MNFKKILALLMAVVMLLSFAACGEQKDEGEKTPTTTVPQETEPEETEPEETKPEIAEVSFFTLSLTDAEGVSKSIFAYPNEGDANTVHIDYVGQVTKRGDIEGDIMAAITEALADSGLVELNGRNEGEFSDVYGSMYISLSDGKDIAADFYGEIPEEFLNGYAAMEACFDSLTADMPEYVPEPMVMGEVADSDKAALDAILAGMTLETPDAYAINGVAKDEFFAVSMGLGSDEGVASGVSFVPMMMSVAYSLNIVTLEEGADVNAIAKDFEENVDWLKWVCVQPTDVLIATNGNQVLCLMGADDLYDMSVAAIEAAGWTTYTTLENPNM